MTDKIALKLNALCDARPFKTGWYLKDLTSGQDDSRHGHDLFPSASTRKVSIMMAALSAIHQNRLGFDDEIVLEQYLKDDVKSGTLQFMTTGMKFPLRDAIVNMIITSDNVATRSILERLKLDEMNRYCRSIGMKDTDHKFLVPPSALPYDHSLGNVTTTTPADQALLLGMIVRGAEDENVARRLGCTPELCRYALDVLSWQKLTKILPSLLPLNTKVGHKTGRGKRGVMDVGVIFHKDAPTYILSYFSDQVPTAMPDGTPGNALAEQHGAQLSKVCWDMIVGR